MQICPPIHLNENVCPNWTVHDYIRKGRWEAGEKCVYSFSTQTFSTQQIALRSADMANLRHVSSEQMMDELDNLNCV